MLKKSVQQGRRRVEIGGVPSGAHGATNKEHQVCARRRVGEAAGSPLRISMSRERRWRAFSASYLEKAALLEKVFVDDRGRFGRKLSPFLKQAFDIFPDQV